MYVGLSAGDAVHSSPRLFSLRVGITLNPPPMWCRGKTSRFMGLLSRTFVRFHIGFALLSNDATVPVPLPSPAFPFFFSSRLIATAVLVRVSCLISFSAPTAPRLSAFAFSFPLTASYGDQLIHSSVLGGFSHHVKLPTLPFCACFDLVTSGVPLR